MKNFIEDTFCMTHEQVGMFVRLLHLQQTKYNNNGTKGITKMEMEQVCNTEYIPSVVFSKFAFDEENGMFYHPKSWAELEGEKWEDGDENELTNYAGFIRFFNAARKSKFRCIKNSKSERQYRARQKEGYTQDIMLSALLKAMNNDYHIKTKYMYLTPEYITRSDKLELWGNI